MCKCDFCDNSKGSRACRTYGGCYWAVQAMIEYKKQLKETVTITCYNNTQKYIRKDALYYFEEAIISVDPESSECERYQHIYEALLAGDTIISDE